MKHKEHQAPVEKSVQPMPTKAIKGDCFAKGLASSSITTTITRNKKNPAGGKKHRGGGQGNDTELYHWDPPPLTHSLPPFLYFISPTLFSGAMKACPLGDEPAYCKSQPLHDPPPHEHFAD